MKHYEYIAIEIDIDDLTSLNNYSADGWQLRAMFAAMQQGLAGVQMKMKALLEREIPEDVAAAVLERARMKSSASA